jgi:hypothetical protein
MKISEIFDRPIAYHRYFVSLAGVTGAVFISQAIYWEKRVPDSRDGWFYKTREEWEEETGLSRREQETARKRLKELGFIEEILKGNPAQLWYRVNFDAVQASWADSAKQVGTIPPNKLGGNSPTIYTETTTENTAEASHPIVIEETNTDFQEHLIKRAKNAVKQETKKKYGGHIPNWVDLDNEVVKKRVSLTQEFESQTAVVNYPTLESVTEEVLVQVAKDKRIHLEDCKTVWEMVQQKVRGSGSGKWRDMAEMLKTYIDYQIQDEKIEKILTYEERIWKEYGMKIDPNAEAEEFIDFRKEKKV